MNPWDGHLSGILSSFPDFTLVHETPIDVRVPSDNQSFTINIKNDVLCETVGAILTAQDFKLRQTTFNKLTVDF